ncbi:hypothetical protein Tco_1382471 [Tanacetum coccineum]
MFLDLKDHIEEDVAETMGESTMEEYMTKTRDDYGSVDLIMKMLMNILRRTASRWPRNEPAGSIDTWETLKKKFLSKYCPPTRTAKKMEEINSFQQEVILFYKGLDVPTRQILDSKGAIPSMKVVDAKKSIQDMADHS